MATKKLKNVFNVMDGWMNLLTGLGTRSKDKRMSNEAFWERMDQVTAEYTYAGDDTAAKVVDIVPEEALREWIKYKNMEKDAESKLTIAVDNIDLQGKFDLAIKWARVYGGAGILMVVDDGLDLIEPLDPDRVRSLQALVVFNRWELSPGDIEDDITNKNFGMPRTYRISPQTTTSTHLQEVHYTRILRFDGVKLPRRLEVQNNYWGDSIFSRLENALRNYNSVNDSAASTMQDFTTDVFKMKNLAELVASGQEDQIKKRIELANMSKSVIRALVLDLEEDYEVKARSLTGVPEILGKTTDRLTVAAGIPHTILLGTSPSGLGANGKSEERTWYDFIKRFQQQNLTRKINLVLPMIAKTDGIKLPADWSWEFNPLWQMTDKEEADMRFVVAQTDKIYTEIGALDASEVTASRFGGEEYSMDTVVDISAREASAKPIASETTSSNVTPEQKAAQESGSNFQHLALNGAQVTALASVVQAAALGQLPRESAIAIITSAFPNSEQEAQRILSNVGKGFVPSTESRPVIGNNGA